jgi:dihydrofolate reductase
MSEAAMHRRSFLTAAALAASGLSISKPRAEETRVRNVTMFNSVSLDGYFTDGGGDMSWAHSQDPEWQRFTSGNAGGEAEFLFGRKTYQMMASFWPTPQALQTMPAVAKAMNAARKIVFSRTLTEATWRNSRIVKGDLVEEVRRMKSEAGPAILIMGSGEIVAQLTEAGLIDEYQVVTVPVILGHGRSLFEGVSRRPRVELTQSRVFTNGNVVSFYRSTPGS